MPTKEKENPDQLLPKIIFLTSTPRNHNSQNSERITNTRESHYPNCGPIISIPEILEQVWIIGVDPQQYPNQTTIPKLNEKSNNLSARLATSLLCKNRQLFQPVDEQKKKRMCWRIPQTREMRMLSNVIKEPNISRSKTSKPSKILELQRRMDTNLNKKATSRRNDSFPKFSKNR